MTTELDALFVEGCDPYRVAASVLLDKPSEAITQDDRDIVKRVFMHVAVRRDEIKRDECGRPLRQAADMFAEIGAAYEARRLRDRAGHKLPQVMYDDFTRKLRTPPEITKIVTDGFALSVRTLAALGAADVMIHECEEPWGSDNVE